MNNFSVKDHLFKYAKNDTIMTLELYRALNILCHKYLQIDILRMLTMGMMANYGFMLNLPKEVLYKSKEGHKRGTVKTRLYLCDSKENDLISRSVTGGRVIPRISHYVSKDHGKSYSDIIDYLVMLDISGMYVYIMKIFDFPFDKSRYANKSELDKYNELIRRNKYDELFKILPEFYIPDVDCQPNEYDLEPPIRRHENKKLIWDCKRRTDSYNSIDIKLLLRNKGHWFEIKKKC